MELRKDFVKWLSKKLYLVQLAFYATVGLIMLTPFLLVKYFGLNQLIASFISIFVIAFLRAGYETLVIYEAPAKHLSPSKMAALSFATALLNTVISYFLKPALGYFSIPVSIIISLVFVVKLKAALWPAGARPGFFAFLPEKLSLVANGRYRFFIFLVGIAYVGYGKLGYSFPITFSIAYLVGMLFEEYYNLTKVYELKLKTKSGFALIILALLFAITSSAITVLMIKGFGFSGQVATISSVVLLKLVQPFFFNKFVLAYNN